VARANHHISDRHYFQIAGHRNDNELTIVGPIVNRINGKSTIIFARGMKGGTDEFIGMVYLSIDLASFEVIHDAVKFIRHLTFFARPKRWYDSHSASKRDSRGGIKVAASSPWYQAGSIGPSATSTRVPGSSPFGRCRGSQLA
jgi:hypothetical protein